MTLEKIFWRDIYAGDRWYDLEEAIEWGKKQYAQEFITVGYVIYEDKDFVLIAATIDPSDQKDINYHDLSLIPQAVIIDREIIN